jgi:transposase-like protein
VPSDQATPFSDENAARQLLEKLRWPKGPECFRANCGGHGADVFLIDGDKHNHRDGLYHCKRCRKGFSVTVGTPLERLRVPLSTWVNAARAFSYTPPIKAKRRLSDGPTKTLRDLQSEIDVSYRTVLRMRDIIKKAVGKYRGYKHVFGDWPRSLMGHVRMSAAKTINSTGVLADALPKGAYAKGEVNRTERLLRLLLASPATPRKRRARAKAVKGITPLQRAASP